MRLRLLLAALAVASLLLVASPPASAQDDGDVTATVETADTAGSTSTDPGAQFLVGRDGDGPGATSFPLARTVVLALGGVVALAAVGVAMARSAS